MKTLVLIPARNEAAQIASVVQQVLKQGFEVLVVDDGSGDQTAALAQAAGARVLRHLVNRGQGAALKTGCAYALKNGYQTVVFFDADGQMMADEIKQIIKPIESGGVQVVLGSRFLGRAKNIGWLKWLTLKLALLFSRWATGLSLTDTHNGFQAWSVAALDQIQLKQDRQAYASEILQQIAAKKLKYLELPVTIEYTAYSKRKGQSVLNAFNILWDLMIKK